MTVRMKALKSFVYAGKRLQTGEEFDCRGQLGRPGSDATVLNAIRHAIVAGPAERAPTTYSTRVMTAALPPAPFSMAPITPRRVSLDDMEADELHALAKRLGVKVHHLAGAKKVRQAILDAQAAE